MTLIELVTHLPLMAAGGPVQNPAPADPTNGSNGISLLLA